MLSHWLNFQGFFFTNGSCVKIETSRKAGQLEISERVSCRSFTGRTAFQKGWDLPLVFVGELCLEYERKSPKGWFLLREFLDGKTWNLFGRKKTLFCMVFVEGSKLLFLVLTRLGPRKHMKIALSFVHVLGVFSSFLHTEKSRRGDQGFHPNPQVFDWVHGKVRHHYGFCHVFFSGCFFWIVKNTRTFRTQKTHFRYHFEVLMSRVQSVVFDVIVASLTPRWLTNFNWLAMPPSTHLMIKSTYDPCESTMLLIEIEDLHFM